ncbi:hypothetical protein [Candidatus Synchoanobacter obligatus]|uniref:Uncharacterized protein n=1 Tax=Candidatus Synchoanobacter obligatus TaxID=2919597 RepID=A0ABT1L6F1_9GAMM|nr:hypothetical protein [Candidatus Synchoanobacter obligatus]MCP8352305.1 hypothetical protein [Candidatus Synchoanobacter obligatus]
MINSIYFVLSAAAKLIDFALYFTLSNIVPVIIANPLLFAIIAAAIYVSPKFRNWILDTSIYVGKTIIQTFGRAIQESTKILGAAVINMVTTTVNILIGGLIIKPAKDSYALSCTCAASLRDRAVVGINHTQENLYDAYDLCVNGFEQDYRI